MKQGQTVYHNKYGKGFILAILTKRQDNLIMCKFPNREEYIFILESYLRSGDKGVTLHPAKEGASKGKDSLESLLHSILTGSEG